MYGWGYSKLGDRLPIRNAERRNNLPAIQAAARQNIISSRSTSRRPVLSATLSDGVLLDYLGGVLIEIQGAHYG